MQLGVCSIDLGDRFAAVKTDQLNRAVARDSFCAGGIAEAICHIGLHSKRGP